jgi:23S rRNA-/tRNA-specific pseudouridylate synthase
VLGDELYGKPAGVGGPTSLALRAVWIGFRDPFRGRMIRIRAESEEFLRSFGFASAEETR